MLVNQEERLLDYLKTNGSVNPLDAWKELGIYRLSAVIFLLRERGYNIETKRNSMLNKFEELCNYAEYELQLEAS